MEALARSDEVLTRIGRGTAVTKGEADSLKDCPVGPDQSCTTSRGMVGTRQDEMTKGISLKGSHSEYSSAEMRETYSLDEKNRF